MLSFVLVAGMASPAFAQESQVGPQVGPQEIVIPEGFSGIESAAPEDIVYDNGSPDFRTWISTSNGFLADDFILGEDATITDIHFIVDILPGFGFTGDVAAYAILADDANNPGVIIKMGVPVDFEIVPIDGENSEIWFDLEEPVPLLAGTKYWLAIDMDAAWTTTDSFIGEEAHAGTPGGSWNEPFAGFDFDLYLNFVLTSKQKLVGGELLPIDSTALILAGAQSFSWMIPVLLSGIGIGLFVVSRKSENS